MTLTEAGQVLAGRTGVVLASWDEALRETRAAGSRAARVLRVGFMSSAASEATQQIIAAFSRRRPDWRVDLRQAAWSDPTGGLAPGDADVAVLRLPFPSQVGVAWPPANDGNPVVQDFVRCCLENKPLGDLQHEGG
jgi:DNA-binding transcriptional LysR family regulator